MPYLVIARKWRPQQFEDVVGQQTITRTLGNAIRQGRVSHAYLFTGTRGVGKTSTARILAKALNCKEGLTPTPCDRCDSCLEIMQGNSVDVLEIDAASNRGIGEIRELRENVRYTPSRDRYKVFIIDEVHMLTMEAFNALLKTLEEPPGHVIFILATTELYKIPQTIVSRCQQFDFRIIPYNEIMERLKKICHSEGVGLSEQAFQYIVKASGGSMRDGETALQKIVSFGGGDIAAEDVAALLGVVRQAHINDMMKAVLERDQRTILSIINELYEKGHDLQNFLRAFVEHLGHITTFKITGSDSHLISLSEEDIRLLQEAAGRLELEDLIRMYDLLVKADNELKWSPFLRFHVEMAFLKLACLPDLASLEEIVLALKEAPAIAGGTPPPPAMLTQGSRAQPAGQPPGPAAQPKETDITRPKEPSADRNTLFLRELPKRFPSLRGLIENAEWQVNPNSIEIRMVENSIQDKMLRLPINISYYKKLFHELFNSEPEIIFRTGPPPAAPERGEVKRQNDERQKHLEALFLRDPVARVLIDNLAGRWVYHGSKN